jgi:hypothetical protein
MLRNAMKHVLLSLHAFQNLYLLIPQYGSRQEYKGEKDEDASNLTPQAHSPMALQSAVHGSNAKFFNGLDTALLQCYIDRTIVGFLLSAKFVYKMYVGG